MVRSLWSRNWRIACVRQICFQFLQCLQQALDVSFRNYTGGLINRHVNFLGRTFWRAWFDIDRVGLEASRRDPYRALSRVFHLVGRKG